MNIEDLNQAYAGCYVTVKDNEGKLPVRILEIVGERDNPRAYVYFPTPSGRRWGSATEVGFHELDLTTPDWGLTNAEGFAVFFRQFPYRQWKKALHTSNTVIDVPVRSIAERVYYIGDILYPNLLKAIYNPVYPEIELAVRDIEQNKSLTVAISPQVFLGISPEYEDIVIGLGTDIVGTFSDGEPLLFEGCEPIQPIVEEALNSHETN